MLFRFPRADLEDGKLRPALLLGRLPGEHGDCLICMISSQLRHEVAGFDEAIGPGDDDFAGSGLKVRSLIRIGRLAVIERSILAGAIGRVADLRLREIRKRLADWILEPGAVDQTMGRG